MTTHVDPSKLISDLEQKWGLPTQLYYDRDIHQLDIDAIFKRTWQYFCPATEISENGDVAVGFAGDVPVVVTRDQAGKLQGLVNMCRHRGYRVAETPQKNCKRLVCRYHAWSYWLDGSLARAPGSNAEPDFPSDNLGLLPVSVELWGPAVFVNAQPDAQPLHVTHPELVERAEEIGFDLDPGSYRFLRESTHEVASNWKVWQDNFVECYHCDHIHRGSFSAAYEADPRLVDTRFAQTFMANRFPPKDSSSTTELRANNYRSLNMFPGLLLLQQDDLMILSQMRPLDTEKTCQTVHYFAQRGSDPKRVEAWVALWEQTFAEDGEAVAVQQAGLRTGALPRNRLMPSREEATVFFNTLTCRAYENHLDGRHEPKSD